LPKVVDAAEVMAGAWSTTIVSCSLVVPPALVAVIVTG
jgi:hypothetical protein